MKQMTLGQRLNTTMAVLLLLLLIGFGLFAWTRQARRDARQNLLEELTKQVDKVKEDVQKDAHRIETGGGFLVAIIAGLAVVVAFKHSSAVHKPLTTLVSSLERMRVGDFTERVELERQDEFGVVG